MSQLHQELLKVLYKQSIHKDFCINGLYLIIDCYKIPMFSAAVSSVSNLDVVVPECIPLVVDRAPTVNLQELKVP